MAALARTVVVVEAGHRSGALITVEHALDLGRDVWSVPGPIDTPSCAGSNQLLADGACPLVSVDRFVSRAAADLGRAGRPRSEGTNGPDAGLSSGAAPGAARRVEAPVPPLEGSDPEHRLLRSLDGDPQHVDQLADRAGLDVQVALAVLVQLELSGAVEQMPGLRFRAA